MNHVHAYLEKAARSFAAAGVLLANGDVDFAASRAYYDCFYVAEALLSDEGPSFSTPAGVIGQYGLLFAKTNGWTDGSTACSTVRSAPGSPPTTRYISIRTRPRSAR